MDGWTEGWVDGWEDEWMDGQRGGWMDGKMNGWERGWKGRREDGRMMDGWTEGCQCQITMTLETHTFYKQIGLYVDVF